MSSFSYMYSPQLRQGNFFVCGSHKGTLTRILLVIPIFISLSYNSPVHVTDTAILSRFWIVQMQTILPSGKSVWHDMKFYVLWNWLTFCIQRTNSVNKSCLQYYILTCSKPFDYGPAALVAAVHTFKTGLSEPLWDWVDKNSPLLWVSGVLPWFNGKWNLHEHYNLVSIKSIFFLPYLI